MIILLGPDYTGKTRLGMKLAKEYGLSYFHYIRDNKYKDYVEDMCSLKWFDSVLDRHAICEYPYSMVMDRPFRFTLKEWHNLILTTLIQNPLVVLCTSKPPEEKYPSSQYLPLSKWNECLDRYKEFLGTHMIRYITYDYSNSPNTSHIYRTAVERSESMRKWWVPMWEKGCGCVGSPHPRVLLVAERIGPNNIHNIPFETGPTGIMLSKLLYETRTPLGAFAVTNLVKAPRGDNRPPDKKDLELLETEVQNLNPEHIVFMGTIARRGIPLAKTYGIEYSEVPHFGALAHKGITDISSYIHHWRKVFGLIPTMKPL